MNEQYAEKDWFSDAALAKQAALANMAPGEATWMDLAGAWEPRTQPADHERCHRCGGDARDGAGGDGHFCDLHLGRGSTSPDDCPVDCHRAIPPEKEQAPEGRYVIQVWGADIGHGELLAVVSDALIARGVKYGRVRVSFARQPLPPAKGGA